MVKDDHEPTLDDVLQPGKNMLAAGYCMYGSSCTVWWITFPVFKWLHLFSFFGIIKMTIVNPLTSPYSFEKCPFMFNFKFDFFYGGTKIVVHGSLSAIVTCTSLCHALTNQYMIWQFVLSTGTGVNGFTLDPSLGEFILTHPDIKVNSVFSSKLWNWNKLNCMITRCS